MQQPKFGMNFTSGVLDPIITFTRVGNTATVTNSSGFIVGVNENTPRFDYDPTTLAPRGLLIEEQRSNLFTRSGSLAVSPWGVNRASRLSSTVLAPDDSLDTIIISATAASGELYQPQTLAAGTYTISMYLRRKTGVGNIGLKVSSFTTVPVDETWRRYSITQTVGANTYFPGVLVSTSGDEVYAWGGQLEAGAFATSYIPTTTAALTRNADIAMITGSNFTSFWNATQGGATVQALPSTVSGIRPLVQYDDGTANEIITLRGNTTNPELYIVDGGMPQAQLDAGTIAANTAYSLTGWWTTNDCRARKDSGAAVTDATATIPTVTQARIGSDGTNYLNGTIATINYYAAFSSQIYTRRKNKVVSSLF
jgi:hypothetical protein